MMTLKKVLRHTILGILILLAFCGIPIVSYLPERREMDVDDKIKNEIVEGSEERD